jgi:hypothetical protein
VSFYPSLYVLFAIGVTCVIKKDFYLLSEILSIKISDSNSHDKEIFLILQVNPDIIDKNALKKILNVNQHFPMSELIYKSLKNNFEKIITTEKDYDECFEYFEIILALIYLKQSGNDFTIRGRYIYRNWRSTNSIASKKFDELQKAQSNFELIKQGLFEDYPELNSYYQKLNTIIENWDRW